VKPSHQEEQHSWLRKSMCNCLHICLNGTFDLQNFSSSLLQNITQVKTICHLVPKTNAKELHFYFIITCQTLREDTIPFQAEASITSRPQLRAAPCLREKTLFRAEASGDDQKSSSGARKCMRKDAFFLSARGHCREAERGGFAKFVRRPIQFVISLFPNDH